MRAPSTTTTLLMAAALLAGACGAGAATPLDDAIDPQWAGALWDDGQAEVAAYRGVRTIYGAPRPHTAHLVTVKEDFHEEQLVKADWPYDGKPIRTVLKQNQVATIETPNYPYHFMASVFQERAAPHRGVKLTVASQEWCGTTFKEFALLDGAGRMAWSSYWEGDASGTAEVEAGAVFEEQLPLLVRALRFQDGLSVPIRLMPNQTTTRASPPRAVDAAIAVERHDGPVAVPFGEAPEAWRVAVRAEDSRTMEFLVAADAPNLLLAYDLGDGRRYELESVRRWAYWEQPR